MRAIRVEVLPDNSLPKQGPGRAENGNFVLANFVVEVVPASGEQPPVRAVLHRAQADFDRQ